MVRLVALLRRPRSPSKYKTLPPLGLHQSAPDRSRCFRRSVREGDRRAFVFDRGRHYDDITQEDEDYAPDEHGDNFAFEDGATTDNDDSWDDDATLLALLDDPDELEHDDKTSIVERLGTAFASHRVSEKEYIKQVFLPLIQNTKHVHTAIEEDISVRFLRGVSLFDDWASHAEEIGRREHQDVLEAYERTKQELDTLFSQLGDLFAESETLLRSFKETAGPIVQDLRRCAAEVPDDVERLISSLEEKAKHLSAEDHAKAKEKLLRGILEKY